MITNADITIYNKKYCPETRADTWHRTFLQGVHFYHENKVQPSTSGLVNADLYKIRIPQAVKTDKAYAPQAEYQAARDISGLWTIQKGDYIVRGARPDIENLQELQKSGLETCKVMSWSDNRRGTQPHFRIDGV